MTSIQIMTVTCEDRFGLVAAISGFLSGYGAYILDANHHTDAGNSRAFLRFLFREQEKPLGLKAWSAAAEALRKTYGAEISFHDATRPMKVMVAVSRFGHCLFDLVQRARAGVLPIEIVAVISNHEDMRAYTEWADIPYHYLPITKETKPEQESKIKQLFTDLNAELLILARYMQILSEDMCEHFDGRAINIHHSFLPSFKGAKPYSQAHQKGVKIIGATAHYVTRELDEGPIIEQAVERVDHSVTVEEFMNIGRDTETLALNRAVRWHAEHRVMMNDKKTVIFK